MTESLKSIACSLIFLALVSNAQTNGEWTANRMPGTNLLWTAQRTSNEVAEARAEAAAAYAAGTNGAAWGAAGWTAGTNGAAWGMAGWTAATNAQALARGATNTAALAYAAGTNGAALGLAGYAAGTNGLAWGLAGWTAATGAIERAWLAYAAGTNGAALGLAGYAAGTNGQALAGAVHALATNALTAATNAQAQASGAVTAAGAALTLAGTYHTAATNALEAATNAQALATAAATNALATHAAATNALALATWPERIWGPLEGLTPTGWEAHAWAEVSRSASPTVTVSGVSWPTNSLWMLNDLPDLTNSYGGTLACAAYTNVSLAGTGLTWPLESGTEVGSNSWEVVSPLGHTNAWVLNRIYNESYNVWNLYLACPQRADGYIFMSQNLGVENLTNETPIMLYKIDVSHLWKAAAALSWQRERAQTNSWALARQTELDALTANWSATNAALYADIAAAVQSWSLSNTLISAFAETNRVTTWPDASDPLAFWVDDTTNRVKYLKTVSGTNFMVTLSEDFEELVTHTRLAWTNNVWPFTDGPWIGIYAGQLLISSGFGSTWTDPGTSFPASLIPDEGAKGTATVSIASFTYTTNIVETWNLTTGNVWQAVAQAAASKELHADSFTNLVWESVYSNGWHWLVAHTNTP